MFGIKTNLPKLVGWVSEMVNAPGAPLPRFLLVLMSPSVMAPGRPNCSWGQAAQVSVTEAPSSKFCAMAQETLRVVMKANARRRTVVWPTGED